MYRLTSASLRKANKSMDKQTSLRRRKRKKAPKISQLKWLKSSRLIRMGKLHLSSRLIRAQKQRVSSR